jgi:hypothetical protein
MGKPLYNGFRYPVLVCEHTFTTKAVPWTIRFRTGTIGVDFGFIRTVYSLIFHGFLPCGIFVEPLSQTGSGQPGCVSFIARCLRNLCW